MSSLHVTAHAALFPAPGETRVDTAPLAEIENPRTLRRMAHFCRLALLAAHRCLAAAPDTERSGLGLVIATGYGPARTSFDYTDSILEFGPHLASPTAFSTSVHNIAASSVSLQLGLTGPVHTVSQGESSMIAALDIASGWLAEGRVSSVLLGALDEYDADLEAMLAAAGGIARPRPVDGALFLLLAAKATHGTALTAWGMGAGPLPPEIAPADAPVFAEGTAPLPRHPAGPTHALAAALAKTSKQAPDARGRALCLDDNLDGLTGYILLGRTAPEQA